MKNSNVSHLGEPDNNGNESDFNQDIVADDQRNENLKSMFRQPNPEFMQKLSNASEEVETINLKRKELNDQLSLIMARFENHGLNKEAVRASIRYNDMNEKQRENYDISYAIMRKAQGQPLQDDLFVASAHRTIKDSQKSTAQH